MENLNKYIDHTLLKPEANREQIEKLCLEASEHDFATVCINPTWVSTCKKLLEGTSVGVCTVIGFPLGATLSSVKAFETRESIQNGATEVDMVINVGALKSSDLQLVENDIKTVVDAAGPTPVKVIIETCLLTDEEKVVACKISEKAGAAFVKTSTGFSTGGATLEDVRLMRQTVSDKVQVKASGGVRDPETARAMIQAGATRLGTSSGVKLMQGQSSSGSY